MGRTRFNPNVVSPCRFADDRYTLRGKYVFRFSGHGVVNQLKNVLSHLNVSNYRATKSRFPIRPDLHPFPYEPGSGIIPTLPRLCWQYKNEPGYENYDKSQSPSPPTPVTTPPGHPSSASSMQSFLSQHSFESMQKGSEKEAKAYIQKIRHETLRISVIDRLEKYLNIGANQNIPVVLARDSDDEEDEDAETTPPPAETPMWMDLCKRMFLWYYDIYLVLPHFLDDTHSSCNVRINVYTRKLSTTK